MSNCEPLFTPRVSCSCPPASVEGEGKEIASIPLSLVPRLKPRFIRFAAVNRPNLDSSPRCRKRKFAPPTDHLSQTPCQQGHDHITTARSCTTRAKRSEIPPWSLEYPPSEDCHTSRDRKRNDIFRLLREKALASIAFRREKQLDSSSNSRERISNRNPKIALPSIQVFREQPFTTGTLRSSHNHAVPKM